MGGHTCSNSLCKKMTWASVQREGCGERADGGDQAGRLYSCPSKRCWWRRLGATLERRREKSGTFIFLVELMGLDGWMWK